MARPRKILAAQTGHEVINFKDARARAEDKVQASTNDLLRKRPRELVSANARKMWKILTEYLLGIQFYGNINVSDAIGYCNAYSAYLDAWAQYKTAESLGEKDYALSLVKKASEEMTRCQNRGGFSVSARLQIGDKEVQKEDEKIEDTFGDI